MVLSPGGSISLADLLIESPRFLSGSLNFPEKGGIGPP